MADFTDDAGNSDLILLLDMVDGDTAGPMVFRAVAESGRTLRAGPAASIVVGARRTGSSGPFQDISSSGIDLTPDPAGSQVRFDVLVTATLASGRAREAVFLGVEDGADGAGWTE